MNTDYNPSKQYMPTEAELHMHSKEKPHFRPNTIQELWHKIRKASKSRKMSMIGKLKGY